MRNKPLLNETAEPEEELTHLPYRLAEVLAEAVRRRPVAERVRERMPRA